MTALRKAALRRGELAVVIMAEIESAQGTGYFWSGLGDIDHDGHVYHGYGGLVSISQVATSTDVEVIEVRFVLSGVDADLLRDLDQSVKSHSARLYEAYLDPDYRVIDRALLVVADLDYRVYAVGDDGKATIALVAQAGFPQLLNRSGAKWSPEEAKAIYPDESGFDEVHIVEDTQDLWQPA